MSVIAWDGKYLAADKQSTCGNVRGVTTKIRRLDNGDIVGWTGKLEHGLLLSEWYANGARRDEWPEFQSEEDWCRLIVSNPAGVFEYEQKPVAQRVEDSFMAWGDGRSIALGALAMGASAAQAVEIANRFSIYCGCGVDVMEAL